MTDALAADLHSLQDAVVQQRWDETAALAHRLRGAVACLHPDPELDQACLVLEMQAARNARAEAEAVPLSAASDRVADRLARCSVANAMHGAGATDSAVQ